MGAEYELTFRGRDQYRNARWSKIGLLTATVLVEAALSFSKLGAAAAWWLVGGTVAFVGLNFVRMRRCRTSVGAAGVTICWGLGPGRTYPWHEIRWVGVREGSTQFGGYSIVQVTLASGRSRSLPVLGRSSLYPDPDFHANFQQVIGWWEASTDPADRYRPTKNWLYRKSPEQIARLLSWVVVAIIVVVVFVFQT